MANLVQLKILEDLNGVLLVDKPAGIAFSTVVKTVKRKFNLVKVGHGGSLDAMASGLLPLLVNDANRHVGDIMGADRSYEGTARLGVSTNTHDVHGETLRSAPPSAIPARDAVVSAAAAFRGDIFQTESRWCSVRREGAADYEIADTGEHAPFLAHVYRFEVGEVSDSRMSFSLSCTKGVLPRTLVNDFGEELGCGACLESLRRVSVGRLRVEDAIPFDKLLEKEIGDFPECVIPTGTALR